MFVILERDWTYINMFIYYLYCLLYRLFIIIIFTYIWTIYIFLFIFLLELVLTVAMDGEIMDEQLLLASSEQSSIPSKSPLSVPFICTHFFGIWNCLRPVSFGSMSWIFSDSDFAILTHVMLISYLIWNVIYPTRITTFLPRVTTLGNPILLSQQHI